MGILIQNFFTKNEAVELLKFYERCFPILSEMRKIILGLEVRDEAKPFILIVIDSLGRYRVRIYDNNLVNPDQEISEPETSIWDDDFEGEFLDPMEAFDGPEPEESIW